MQKKKEKKEESFGEHEAADLKSAVLKLSN